jgi:hypothetical protein
MMDIIAMMAEEAAAEAAAAAAAEAAASTVATEAAATAIPEMASTAMPDMSGMSTPQVAPPMSFGQQMGNVATNALNQQIAPTQSLFNTVINPQSTAGDIGRSAFEYSIKQKEEPSMAPQMNPYSNPYTNMANNTVGGIPSLLQNTQSGLLPFFGAR